MVALYSSRVGESHTIAFCELRDGDGIRLGRVKLYWFLGFELLWLRLSSFGGVHG